MNLYRHRGVDAASLGRPWKLEGPLGSVADGSPQEGETKREMVPWRDTPALERRRRDLSSQSQGILGGSMTIAIPPMVRRYSWTTRPGLVGGCAHDKVTCLHVSLLGGLGRLLQVAAEARQGRCQAHCPGLSGLTLT